MATTSSTPAYILSNAGYHIDFVSTGHELGDTSVRGAQAGVDGGSSLSGSSSSSGSKSSGGTAEAASSTAGSSNGIDAKHALALAKLRDDYLDGKITWDELNAGAAKEGAYPVVEDSTGKQAPDALVQQLVHSQAGQQVRLNAAGEIIDILQEFNGTVTDVVLGVVDFPFNVVSGLLGGLGISTAVVDTITDAINSFAREGVEGTFNEVASSIGHFIGDPIDKIAAPILIPPTP